MTEMCTLLSVMLKSRRYCVIVQTVPKHVLSSPPLSISYCASHILCRHFHLDLFRPPQQFPCSKSTENMFWHSMSEEESFWKMKKEGDLKFIKGKSTSFPSLNETLSKVILLHVSAETFLKCSKWLLKDIRLMGKGIRAHKQGHHSSCSAANLMFLF